MRLMTLRALSTSLYTLDASALSVMECSQGPDWSGLFDCNINDPLNQVKVVGNNLESSATGTALHIATFRVAALTTAAGELLGTSTHLTLHRQTNSARLYERGLIDNNHSIDVA